MSLETGDILRIVASMLWTDGNINQNVYNAVITGGGGPWDNQDAADDAEDWLDDMYDQLATSCSDQIAGNEVIIYKYDSVGDDWDEVTSQSWSWAGVSNTDQLPRGSAALVRLWTDDPDVQGKKYIPGLIEGTLTGGLYTGTLLTTLLAYAADWYLPFVGAASGATFTPGVWSVVGKVFEAAVEHYATSSIPAYQRRRKRGVGI